MSRAVTHRRVSEDVSVDRVNRVNRQQHGDRLGGESAGRTGQSGGLVWRNIGALRSLFAWAERELAREPGAYVAVSVVHGDKREEQAGRWGWAGSREAGAQVAGMGTRLAPGDRGLRVRVHREGGALVGSTLLRRTVAASSTGQLPRVMHPGAPAQEASRLAAVEAQLAQLLARVATLDREIALLNATIEELGPVDMRLGNLHTRLDDLEAAAHRHPEDDEGVGDDEEEAEAEEDDGEDGGSDE